LTSKLLLCGAIAGPLFLLTLLIQDYTVPGFDPRLDLLSLLSLGDWNLEPLLRTRTMHKRQRSDHDRT
jgi:hypothetical protein